MKNLENLEAELYRESLARILAISRSQLRAILAQCRDDCFTFKDGVLYARLPLKIRNQLIANLESFKAAVASVTPVSQLHLISEQSLPLIASIDPDFIDWSLIDPSGLLKNQESRKMLFRVIARYRTMMQLSPAAICVKDRQGNYLDANYTRERIGIDCEQVIGHNTFELGFLAHVWDVNHDMLKECFSFPEIPVYRHIPIELIPGIKTPFICRAVAIGEELLAIAWKDSAVH